MGTNLWILVFAILGGLGGIEHELYPGRDHWRHKYLAAYIYQRDRLQHSHI